MDPSIILLLALIPLLFLMFRGSRQRRAVAEMQSALGPGDEVMTASGQFGRVVSVTSDRVELEVADGVRTWWIRQAIARAVEPVAAEEAALEAADDQPVVDRVDGPDGPVDGTSRPA